MRLLGAFLAFGFLARGVFAGQTGVNPVAAPAVPLRLIIAGPPGAGKDTMAERLVQDYGVVHVRASALLTKQAKIEPKIAELQSKGILVRAPLVVKLIRERLAKPDVVEKGYLLNGAPRRLAEAKSFKQLLKSVDAVIVLKVPQKELWRRVTARGREDADIKVFKRRMRIYRKKTVPAVAFLKRRLPVLSLDVSSTDIEGNYRAVKAKLEQFLAHRSPAAR